VKKRLNLLGIGEGIEFAIVGLVCAERKDDDVWLEVLQLFDCPRCFVDQVRKLSPHNTTVVIHYTASFVGYEFKSIESKVILIRAYFGQCELELIGGCCGLIGANAPAGGVKLTSSPLERGGKSW